METTISNHRKKKRVVTTVAQKDWSSLHQDFISCFAQQIVSMKDFFAFGGVCKSWRSEAIKEKSNTALRLQHKVPVLLLPKEINAPIRNIYSLTEGQISQLDLPETKGKFCCSSLGWLLTVSQDYLKLTPAHIDLLNPLTHARIDLFNPLTHAHIQLPALPRTIFSLRHMKKFLLSSSPSWTSDYGVMLLSDTHLAFYKPGYNNGAWTTRKLSLMDKMCPGVEDGIYFKGQYYVVDCFGNVFVCEIDENPKNVQMRLVAPQPEEQLFSPEIHVRKPHLVESATGTLLLVLLVLTEDYEVTTFRVFEVPIDTGTSWAKSEVKSLGNKTLFLGAHNSSFWIEPLDDSICKANCIYFLNSWRFVSTVDNGVYYMEDGKVDKQLVQLPDSHYKGSNSLSSYSWLQPSL